MGMQRLGQSKMQSPVQTHLRAAETHRAWGSGPEMTDDSYYIF